MAQCPECQHEVSDDFGLITCGNCGASLFVDMDGQVISGEGSQEDVQEEAALSPSEHFHAIEEELDAHVQPQESVGPEPEDPVENSLEQEADFEQDWQEESGSEAEAESLEQIPEEGPADFLEEEAVEEVLDEEVQAPQEASIYFDDESDANSQPSPMYQPEPTSSDFGDVVEFANSDLSQARDGGLMYNLTISGIDTMDLRNAVKEAMTDKRFIWDTEAMIRGIKDGILFIEQVTAVKAFILVSRLAHLPVQIEWVQQPLNQP